MSVKLAIFVSGSGSNCENIIKYFAGNKEVEISIVVSNKPDAYALTRAHNLNVKTSIITAQQLREDQKLVLSTIEGCNWIILAGFLPKVPQYLIDLFPNRIINIHPSLLPKFGGKGMWGHHVHEAVKAAGETETGITIHYVNANLDEGQQIAQFKTQLTPEDTPDTIADKVHVLEMAHFPVVLEEVFKKG